MVWMRFHTETFYTWTAGVPPAEYRKLDLRQMLKLFGAVLC